MSMIKIGLKTSFKEVSLLVLPYIVLSTFPEGVCTQFPTYLQHRSGLINSPSVQFDPASSLQAVWSCQVHIADIHFSYPHSTSSICLRKENFSKIFPHPRSLVSHTSLSASPHLLNSNVLLMSRRHGSLACYSCRKRKGCLDGKTQGQIFSPCIFFFFSRSSLYSGP